MSTPWGGNFPVGTQYQLSKLVPAKITPGVSMEGMCPAWQFPDGLLELWQEESPEAFCRILCLVR